MNNWIEVSERFPATRERVILCFTNKYKARITTIAEYIEPMTVPEEDYMDPDYWEGPGDYDEEKDIYYTPGGWYEWQYTTEVNWFICKPMDVDCWMPLPGKPII